MAGAEFPTSISPDPGRPRPQLSLPSRHCGEDYFPERRPQPMSGEGRFRGSLRSSQALPRTFQTRTQGQMDARHGGERKPLSHRGAGTQPVREPAGTTAAGARKAESAPATLRRRTGRADARLRAQAHPAPCAAPRRPISAEAARRHWAAQVCRIPTGDWNLRLQFEILKWP